MVHATLYVKPHNGVYIYSFAILMSMSVTTWVLHVARKIAHEPDLPTELTDCAMVSLSEDEEPVFAAIDDVSDSEVRDDDAMLSPVRLTSPIRRCSLWRVLEFTVVAFTALLTTLGLLLPIYRCVCLGFPLLSFGE